PILLTRNSANQSAPSGPAVIPWPPLVPGIGNSVKRPSVVSRPILSYCVYQSAPSGPAVMSWGTAPTRVSGVLNALKLPEVVILPTLPLPKSSVNHSAPSGPAVIPPGFPFGSLGWV